MLQETEQSDAPQLEEIATFLRVVEDGSLTAAARRLGLPKSTVSRRITRLEEKLGARLVQRTTRRLALTDVGAAYRERVAGAMARLDEAAEAVRDRSARPRGHLRVTAPSDIGTTYLGGVCADFVRRHPDSSVEVVLTERMLDLVAEGIDLAVRAAPSLPDSSLVARRIAQFEFGLFATPELLRARGAPRAVADLAAHDFVLHRATHGRGVLRLAGPDGAEQVHVRAALTCNDFSLVHSAALAHVGIASMPALRATEDVRAGRLRRVLPDHTTGTGGLYVVHPSAKLLSANVRVFRDLLVERLGALGAGPAPVTEPPPARAPRKRRPR